MKTIVVIGDAIVDAYTEIAGSRKSPEAECPCFLVGASGASLGGAANVAMNVVSLGGQAKLISAIGSDPVGEMCVQMTNSVDGIESHLLALPGHITPFKTRYIAANGKHVFRIDCERIAAMTHEQHDAAVARIEEAAASADAMVISDYGKGFVTPKVAKAAIWVARRVGCPVVVDAKDPSLTHFKLATVLKPNVQEMGAALPLAETPLTDQEAADAALRLRGITGVAYVLLTRGRDGMCLVGDGGVEHIRAALVDEIDVTGAGDTVAAALALMLAEDRTMSEAAHFANFAAGVAVSKRYTATVTQDEVRSLADQTSRHRRSNLGVLAQERSQGRLH